MHATEHALSIAQWCEKWSFSRAYYYLLKKRGNAPAEMRIGRAVRITPEADDAWAKAQVKRTLTTRPMPPDGTLPPPPC